MTTKGKIHKKNRWLMCSNGVNIHLLSAISSISLFPQVIGSVLPPYSAWTKQTIDPWPPEIQLNLHQHFSPVVICISKSHAYFTNPFNRKKLSQFFKILLYVPWLENFQQPFFQSALTIVSFNVQTALFLGR